MAWERKEKRDPENVEVTYNPETDKIVITIDAGVDLGPSSTGRTDTVASTHGLAIVELKLYGEDSVPVKFFLSLNLSKGRADQRRDRNRSRDEFDERWA